jgi:hypothetical protein
VFVVAGALVVCRSRCGCCARSAGDVVVALPVNVSSKSEQMIRDKRCFLIIISVGGSTMMKSRIK